MTADPGQPEAKAAAPEVFPCPTCPYPQTCTADRQCRVATPLSGKPSETPRRKRKDPPADMADAKPARRKKAKPAAAPKPEVAVAPEAEEKASPGRGRPTEYKAEFVAQARKLAELGATDREVADFFEVSEATVYRWQHTHPDFCEALKVGKETADDRVEKSLYRRATGYTFDSVKIFQYEGVPVVEPFEEHVPPDVTACIFWLKNRRRAQWRDKVDHELAGKDGGPIQTEDVSAPDLARRIAFLLAKGLQPDPKETTK